MTTSGVRLRCCLCKERFVDIHALEAHLATQHVFYTAYECEICGDALFPTDHSLREHYQKIHAKRVYMIKYKVSPELEQRREHLQQLLAQSSGGISSSIMMQEEQQQQSDLFDGHYNPHITQLLESCSVQLLQEQMARSAEQLIAMRSNGSEVDEVVKMESSDMAEGSSSKSHGPLKEEEMNQQRAEEADNMFEQFGMDGHENGMEMAAQQMEGSIVDESFESNSSSTNKKRGRRKKSEKQHEEGVGTDEVECVECRRKVARFRNSMLIHTSTHHCDQPIFECLAQGCGKKWYSLSARTKQHIESKHEGQHLLLKDNRAELVPQLKAKTAQLFPNFYACSSRMSLRTALE